MGAPVDERSSDVLHADDSVRVGGFDVRRGPQAAGPEVEDLARRVAARRPTRYERWAKPALDRTLAALLLLVLAPVLLAAALAVAASVGAPLLFRQRRTGLDGTTFAMLKFRTMRPDRRAHQLSVIHDRRATHKSAADPRHTRIGRVLRKYSLDELPQLINVVRGEMSVVGPRPELESVVATYRGGLEQRHLVKPGLTGLWQVNARGAGPMHENGGWDLDYVERVSLRMDLVILARTPGAVLARRPGD